MKNALLIGCGGDRASRITQGCLNAGHSVINIGATKSTFASVKNIQIDWQDFDLIQMHKICRDIDQDISFIFFNHNASTLAPSDFESIDTVQLWGTIKRWTHTHWLSCQMPYALIQSLGSRLVHNAKIGWMLSGFIEHTKEGVDQHADYSGNKFTNFLMMRNFSRRFQTFGISPDFTQNQKPKYITNTITEICNGSKKCDGKIF